MLVCQVVCDSSSLTTSVVLSWQTMQATKKYCPQISTPVSQALISHATLSSYAKTLKTLLKPSKHIFLKFHAMPVCHVVLSRQRILLFLMLYIYTTYRLPRTVTQRMPTCVDASTCSSIFWRNSIVLRYLPLTFCCRPAAFAVARRTFCGQLPSCATTASRPHSRKVSFKDSSCSAMAYPQTTVSRHICLTNSMQLPKASQSILCLIHCHYCSGVSTDTPLPLRIKTLCNISLETLSFILSAQTNP